MDCNDSKTLGMTRVVVAGAGLVGLCTAYYATKAGAEVLVLDRGEIGAGASLGNAGWLATSLSGPLPGRGLARVALASLLDRDGAFRLPWRQAVPSLPWLWQFRRFCNEPAYQRGLEATAGLARESLALYDGLAADGVQFHMASTGLLYVAQSQEKAEIARKALVPLAVFGVDAGPLLQGPDLCSLEPSLTNRELSGFLVASDRSVDPGSLLHGLVDRLVQMGVEIRTGAEVEDIESRDGWVRAVRVDGARYPADTVVLATGARTGQLAARSRLRLPMRAGTGYSFSVSPPMVPARPLYLVEAKVAITPMPNRVRVTGGFDLTGVNAALRGTRVQAVAAAASAYAGWTVGRREDSWVGSRPVLPDGLPAVGAVPHVGGLYVNSGHGMLGVTLAAASGKMLVDVINQGLSDVPLDPFAPARFDRRRWPKRPRAESGSGLRTRAGRGSRSGSAPTRRLGRGSPNE